MKGTVRVSLAVACGLVLLGAGWDPGWGQDKFPTKPIEVVNQFGPGGGTDIYVRTLAIPARKFLKGNIVVNNLTGGGGVPAESYVLGQPADGHTLFAIGPEQVINTILKRGDINKFDPIIMSQHDQSMLYINPEKSKFKDIKEIVEFAKKNPGAVKISLTGAAGFDEVAVGLFSLRSGAQLTRVPFDGSQEALSALLGGHVDLLHEEPGVVTSLIEAKKLKPVVVFTESRIQQFADVPTAKELGWDVTLGRWRGIVAPKGTPKAAVQFLHDGFKQAMDDKAVYLPVVKGQLLDLRPGYKDPEAFGKFLQDELKVYAEVMKALAFVKE